MTQGIFSGICKTAATTVAMEGVNSCFVNSVANPQSLTWAQKNFVQVVSGAMGGIVISPLVYASNVMRASFRQFPTESVFGALRNHVVHNMGSNWSHFENTLVGCGARGLLIGSAMAVGKFAYEQIQKR